MAHVHTIRIAVNINDQSNDFFVSKTVPSTVNRT